MTFDQFWNDDPEIVKYYRRADEIRQERENTHAWLQGMYVYEAIGAMVPVLRAFSKARRPGKYSDSPYELNTFLGREKKEKRKLKEDELFIAQMNAWADRVNRKMLAEKKMRVEPDSDGPDEAQTGENAEQEV